MDDFDEPVANPDDIENQIWIIRGIVEKTEREVRHIGIALGLGWVVLVYMLLK